jgi:PAS domain S-box-containing protein
MPEVPLTPLGWPETSLFSREIIAHAGEGIIVYDQNLCYSVWNPFMEKLTGLRSDQVLGQKAVDLFPHLREQGILDLLQKALQGETVSSPDVPYRVPSSGRQGWVSGSYAPLRNPDGQIIGVIGIIRDVTARKESQLALEFRCELEKIITSVSSHFINLATEEIDHGINLALEKIGRFVKADRSYFFAVLENKTSYCNTHEWCAEGILPQKERCQDLPFTSLPWFSAHMKRDDVFLVPSVAQLPSEAAAEKAEFEAQQIQSLVCVPAMARGELIGFLGFDSVQEARSWDEDSLSLLRITGEIIMAALQRKRAEEALRRSEEQLQQSQKMDAIGRLAGGIAHDFNNLLTAILGYCNLLNRATSVTAHTHEQVREIEKAADRAAALTNQLLAFSRQQVQTPRVFNLNDAIQEMSNLFLRLVGESITVSFELDPKLGPIRADSMQLEQVMMNLVINARDAMPTGGRVEITTHNLTVDAALAQVLELPFQGPCVVAKVSDTGCGMDEQTKSRIFEPFFTTKEPGKGVGLGLAMVYGLVQQSRGVIKVKSRPQVGTTFEIYLPCVADRQDPMPSRPAPQPLPSGCETILLVEDEDSVRQLVAHMLTQSGYTVWEAVNGKEALQILDQHRIIDLLITDVVMPVMGGRELVAQLPEAHSRLPVIFISGYANDTPVTALKSGQPAFIPKPFSLDVLAKKTREVLDLSHR